ncbi:hypothetical protein BDR06DRAFT_1028179 [Suillus hirtellus]|nr:hypothetical protein BDR06DRAFT_1028179 [Suillus hirtellus]
MLQTTMILVINAVVRELCLNLTKSLLIRLNLGLGNRAHSSSQAIRPSRLSSQTLVNLAHGRVHLSILKELMAVGLYKEVHQLTEWSGADSMLMVWQVPSFVRASQGNGTITSFLEHTTWSNTIMKDAVLPTPVPATIEAQKDLMPLQHLRVACVMVVD